MHTDSLSPLLPMGHLFVFIVAMLGLRVAENHGSLSSEVYWQSKFPNTPMPKVIREHLNAGGMLHDPVYIHDVKQPYGVFAWLAGEKEVAIHDVKQPYGVFAWLAGEKEVAIHDVKQPYGVFAWLSKDKTKKSANVLSKGHDPKEFEQSTYFLESDLHVGAKFEAMFQRPLNGDHFLPQRMANIIPFSSGKLPEILKLFSIAPNSFKAEKMKEVVQACERPPLLGVKNHCATSLESMVDFVASNLNVTSSMHTVINAISPEPENETTSMEAYTVASFTAVAMEATTSIVCHLQPYLYTVYHCHTDQSVMPYIVRLVRQSDGFTAEATAMCHHDTTNWDPEFYGLRALNARPGGASVCHLLPVGDIAFVPTTSATIATSNNNLSVQ